MLFTKKAALPETAMVQEGALKNILPVAAPEMVDRWNKEWMLYFSTEDMTQHIIPWNKIRFTGKLEGKSEQELHGTSMGTLPNGKALTPLHAWVSGEDVIGKNIVEIGCGCGLMAKQLATVANHYLGMDYSELALAIARGNSPSNVTYLHLGDAEEIAALEGTRDILVGREFFIHQNFDNALWVLKLGAFLLKPGGIIAADFYEGDPAVPQGVIHPARSPLDPKYASCCFNFSHADIYDLAQQTGLEVVSMQDYLPHQRRFVRFRKPS